MPKTIPLDKFLQISHTRILNFAQAYHACHEKNPREYPMDGPHFLFESKFFAYISKEIAEVCADARAEQQLPVTVKALEETDPEVVAEPAEQRTA